mmetsp:Transcript_27088/g.62346  ORF Transcript_27088/g.62346 Transcript_27088/m.62346 type:complete len:215 (+) Transcript_27088:810-1454(+)
MEVVELSARRVNHAERGDRRRREILRPRDDLAAERVTAVGKEVARRRRMRLASKSRRLREPVVKDAGERKVAQRQGLAVEHPDSVALRTHAPDPVQLLQGLVLPLALPEAPLAHGARELGIHCRGRGPKRGQEPLHRQRRCEALAVRRARPLRVASLERGDRGLVVDDVEDFDRVGVARVLRNAFEHTREGVVVRRVCRAQHAVDTRGAAQHRH